jgi:hypothetical protein
MARVTPRHPVDALRAQWNRVRVARADILRTRETAERLSAELSACRSEIAALTARVEELQQFTNGAHQATLAGLRFARDDDVRSRATLWELRETPEYARAFEEDEPLITVLVTTYRNWPLLRDRSLPSILAQSYERFECIVVGDAAPPEAEEVVRSFADDRVRFVNLPYRGPYPAESERAWLVSATTPWNTGLALARGRWIPSNSDDDALRPNCLEVLLRLAREQRAEVPYGRIDQREPDGPGTLLGRFPPALGHWGTQSSLFHAGLRFMPLQPTDWLFGLPNDWALAERMLRIGVRFAMSEEPVVDYYPSYLWTDRLTRSHF